MKRQALKSSVLLGRRRCPPKTRAMVNQLVRLSLGMSHRRGASRPSERTTEETQGELAALSEKALGIQGEAKDVEE